MGPSPHADPFPRRGLNRHASVGLSAVLLGILGAVLGCGVIDDAFSLPVSGHFGGSVQIDATALDPSPVPADCMAVQCAEGRDDCHSSLAYGPTAADGCPITLEETLRLDVDLGTSLPDLAKVEQMVEVTSLGPITYTYQSNTLGDDAAMPVTVLLGPKNDVDPTLRIKLAELPRAPELTPATGTIEIDSMAQAQVKQMLTSGERQFSLIVKMNIGPLQPGMSPPTGLVSLDVQISLALKGKPLE